MDWLRKILETVTGADSLLEQIKQGIAKEFVSKSDFNTKVNEVKELNTKVEGLEKTIKDSGDATQKLGELQAKYDKDTGDLKNQFAQYKKDSALDSKIAQSGAKNSKAFKALLDLSKISFNDDGTIKDGYDDQEKAIKKSDAYLFGTSSPTPIIRKSPNPAPGAGGGSDDNENFGAQIAKEMNAGGASAESAFGALFGIGTNK